MIDHLKSGHVRFRIPTVLEILVSSNQMALPFVTSQWLGPELEDENARLHLSDIWKPVQFSSWWTLLKLKFRHFYHLNTGLVRCPDTYCNCHYVGSETIAIQSIFFNSVTRHEEIQNKFFFRSKNLKSLIYNWQFWKSNLLKILFQFNMPADCVQL